jgi:hypothetical protein
MRSFLSRVTVRALSFGCYVLGSQVLGFAVLGSQVSLAQTPDCKTITDPATRLTCYDKINPPIATYPIPLAKPTARPLSTPQGIEVDGTGPAGDDDTAMVARMNGICRGC